MRSPPSAIDALDTLYEPNAVFLSVPRVSRYGVFPLSLFPLVFSFLFLSFPIPFSLSFLFFSLLFSRLFFVFSNRIESDVRMRSDRYYV